MGAGSDYGETDCYTNISLLEKVLKENNFPLHNIYGFDESGYPLGRGMKHCTIGKSKSKQHKMQQSGSKEMVTVMVTICADGSNVPPVLIFKGQYFLEKWCQENPISAPCISDHSSIYRIRLTSIQFTVIVALKKAGPIMRLQQIILTGSMSIQIPNWRLERSAYSCWTDMSHTSQKPSSNMQLS